MPIRIGLIHALMSSMDPLNMAFKEQWPSAEVIHLFDGSLYPDYSRAGRITPEIARRVRELICYSAASGANQILFTGSLFSEPVRAARADLSIPVLTAYEALIEAAFSVGSRFSLLATVPDTILHLQADIARFADAQDVKYSLDSHLVEGALAALQSGDRRLHDELICRAADRMADCEALLLAQHSMGAVRSKLVPVPGRTVLASPETAVAKLKRLAES